MKTLLKNARILSLEKGFSIVEGDVLVEYGAIKKIGKNLPSKGVDKTVDCRGGLLLPGFKNAHTHSAMTFARSYSDDLPLHDWLFKRIFPLEGLIKPEDQYYLSRLAILEYLTSGITACFDMYYNPLEMARAAKEMGFKAVLLGTVTKERESVAEMVESYRKINDGNPLVSYQLGFHAEYTCSEDILVELSKASHKLKCPVYSHTSETYSEYEGCKARHHGLDPVEYAESLGLLDYGGGGFHGVAFSRSDIAIYKKHGCSLVTCPGSNSKLASGIAPLTDVLSAGVNLAIGTDGPGSNNGLDFFYEMRLASVLQKLRTMDPSAFKGTDALYAATVGGSIAMGLLDARYVKEGERADLVLIDLDKPDMRPLNDIPNNLVYAGSKLDVRMTMVEGKILYLDGQFDVGTPVEEIVAKAEEVTSRLKAEFEGRP